MVKQQLRHQTKAGRVCRKYLFILSILIIPALFFCTFYIGVNTNSFVLAFQRISISGDKTFVGWVNFKEAFLGLQGGELLLLSVKNSLIMYVISLLVCNPLYIIFSYFLFRKCAGYKVIRFVIMIPTIISGFVVSLIFKQFLQEALPALLGKLGFDNVQNLLFDSRYSFGTTLFFSIWLSFATSLIVYPNAMNAIDDEVIESARLEGANTFREIWHIILPLIYPTFTTFFVTGFASIFTNCGPLVEFYQFNAPQETYNVGYFLFASTMNSDSMVSYPRIAATGIIFTLVVTPLTYLVKHLMEKYGPSVE